MPAITRILVPVDFSPCSRAAFEYGASLASQLGASLEVLHVLGPPNVVNLDLPGALGTPTTFKRYERTLAAREMEKLLSDVSHAGKPAIKARIEEGDAAATIVWIAEQRGCELIVMGTHGRTGLARVLLGSVAENVVRLAPCPVLTVRLPDEAAVVRAS